MAIYGMKISDIIICFGGAWIIGTVAGKLAKWLEGDDERR